MDRENSAVVLLSGGMDSSTLAHLVSKKLGKTPVYTAAFDYGQRHSRELACAQRQSEACGAVGHEVFDLSNVFGFLAQGTALVKGGGEVPDLADLPEAELDQPPTYVPNRNMMLLSIAAAYAESIGAAEIYYGAQAMDEYGYWDCTAAFLDRINETLSLNRRTPVKVIAPFIATPKSGIVKLGLELGVDFAQTWSCYRGGDAPCGTCPTCVERANAFREAGVADPLLAS